MEKLSIYKTKLFDATSDEAVANRKTKTLGRKLKDGMPRDQKVTVYFTKTEKNTLERISEEHHGVPIGRLIRNICRKQGLI